MNKERTRAEIKALADWLLKLPDTVNIETSRPTREISPKDGCRRYAKGDDIFIHINNLPDSGKDEGIRQ